MRVGVGDDRRRIEGTVVVHSEGRTVGGGVAQGVHVAQGVLVPVVGRVDGQVGLGQSKKDRLRGVLRLVPVVARIGEVSVKAFKRGKGGKEKGG